MKSYHIELDRGGGHYIRVLHFTSLHNSPFAICMLLDLILELVDLLIQNYTRSVLPHVFVKQKQL